MPSIQVRDLPEQIYRKIQMSAKKDHRSLSQQAIVTLKKGLGVDENHKERRRILVDQILSRRVLIDMTNLKIRQTLFEKTGTGNDHCARYKRSRRNCTSDGNMRYLLGEMLQKQTG